MSTTPDLYAVLGVSPFADDVVIHAAYKALILKYHPDTNTTLGAAERAAAINAAFGVLGEHAKRASYDALLRAEYRSVRQERAQVRGRALLPTARLVQASQILSHGKFAGPWVAMIMIIAFAGSAILGTDYPSARVAAADISAATQDTAGASPAPVDSSPSVLSEQSASDPTDIVSTVQLLPPETALSYADIETGADGLNQVLQKEGLAGARASSEACHKSVISEPSWAAADRCAAFDYSASLVDKKDAKAARRQPDGYFAFQEDNQAANYGPLGGMTYAVDLRLQEIQERARSAIHNSIATRIARSEAARNAQKVDYPPNASAEAPPVSAWRRAYIAKHGHQPPRPKLLSGSTQVLAGARQNAPANEARSN